MGVASAPAGETCLSEAARLMWGSVWAQGFLRLRGGFLGMVFIAKANVSPAPWNRFPWRGLGLALSS